MPVTEHDFPEGMLFLAVSVFLQVFPVFPVKKGDQTCQKEHCKKAAFQDIKDTGIGGNCNQGQQICIVCVQSDNQKRCQNGGENPGSQTENNAEQAGCAFSSFPSHLKRENMAD